MVTVATGNCDAFRRGRCCRHGVDSQMAFSALIKKAFKLSSWQEIFKRTRAKKNEEVVSEFEIDVEIAARLARHMQDAYMDSWLSWLPIGENSSG